MRSDTKWADASGFGNLSSGAQKIGTYADQNDGNISGLLQENPELIGSLDEFHKWSAITVPEISGNDATATTGHSMKKKIG
jgi:hypothetical protein